MKALEGILQMLYTLLPGDNAHSAKRTRVEKTAARYGNCSTCEIMFDVTVSLEESQKGACARHSNHEQMHEDECPEMLSITTNLGMNGRGTNLSATSAGCEFNRHSTTTLTDGWWHETRDLRNSSSDEEGPENEVAITDDGARDDANEFEE
ncbi:hypothetical protein EJ08DRAFT_735975 [Tothia fuscella]|uniref:Uncharacterized protein n=1 Tax=Tothia fuscella TaxID=1048955 RepID=A0A9P4NLT2_9PEZI|nr:hypothetical protein EJ08DRAFT_735975 [Tothia fuscella]